MVFKSISMTNIISVCLDTGMSLKVAHSENHPAGLLTKNRLQDFMLLPVPQKRSPQKENLLVVLQGSEKD